MLSTNSRDSDFVQALAHTSNNLFIYVNQTRKIPGHQMAIVPLFLVTRDNFKSKFQPFELLFWGLRWVIFWQFCTKMYLFLHINVTVHWNDLIKIWFFFLGPKYSKGDWGGIYSGNANGIVDGWENPTDCYGESSQDRPDDRISGLDPEHHRTGQILWKCEDCFSTAQMIQKSGTKGFPESHDKIISKFVIKLLNYNEKCNWLYFVLNLSRLWWPGGLEYRCVTIVRSSPTRAVSNLRHKLM